MQQEAKVKTGKQKMGKKILLVEDDYALAMGTEYTLKTEGYEVFHGSSIAEAKKLIDRQPDLVLLDVMLPDGTGYDFCKYVREMNNYVPIIFLTAIADEVNLVQGLELGADDYIAKPYRVKELLTRIGAVLRRQEYNQKPEQRTKAEEYITFGTTKLDLTAYRVYRNGILLECTPSELRLLKELVTHKNQIMTRRELIERLWDVDEAFVDDNTLSVYIKRLRDKLGADAEYIKTVRGIGYEFTGGK
jgi:DNA-binding response OmpR family regulator